MSEKKKLEEKLIEITKGINRLSKCPKVEMCTNDCPVCRMNEILTAIREAGLVELAEDQSAPEYTFTKVGVYGLTHRTEAQKDMLTPAPDGKGYQTRWVKIREAVK